MSEPRADFSITTHLETKWGIDSPWGRKTAFPKSTTTPTRFWVADLNFVLPHNREKFGANIGCEACGTLSPLKVKTHPSTDPSATTVVGPVIASLQEVSPGAAWK